MPLIYCFLYTRSKDVYVTIVYVSIHLLNPEEKRKQIFREDVDRCRGRPSRVDDAVQGASKTNLFWLVTARATSIVVYNNQGLSRLVGKRLTRRGSIPAWSIRSSSWRTQSFPDTDQVLGRIILVDERLGLSGRIMGLEFLPEIRLRWTRNTFHGPYPE